MTSHRVAGISVIIPTKQRVPLVRQAVHSLQRAANHLPAGCAWEVLLVDDSPEPAASQLRSLADPLGQVRYLRGPVKVGAKRNYGAARARHDYLVFLDSDCWVSEPFLVAHAAAAGRGLSPSGRPVGAIAGPVELADDARTWLTRLADYSPLFNAPFGWPARYAELYWACTANLAVSRKVFEAVGGFDEDTFTVVGGEDVDFSLRLNNAGFAICAERAAAAHHTATLLTNFGDMASKMVLYGRSSVYNTTRHPSHGQWHANPSLLAIAGAGGLIAGRRAGRAGRAAALAAAAVFAAQSARLMIRNARPSMLAMPATALEWIFDAGIAMEAVRRGRPAEAFRRFRYFDESRWIPFADDDTSAAV